MKSFVVILLGFTAFTGRTEQVAPIKPMKPTVGFFLAKANDNLISHCKCKQTFIGAPAQMDCPCVDAAGYSFAPSVEKHLRLLARKSVT